jgi:hypothetical protein
MKAAPLKILRSIFKAAMEEGRRFRSSLSSFKKVTYLSCGPAIWLAAWCIPLEVVWMHLHPLFAAILSAPISSLLFLASPRLACWWRSRLGTLAKEQDSLIGSLLLTGVLLGIAFSYRSLGDDVATMIRSGWHGEALAGIYLPQVVLLIASAGYLFKTPWDHSVKLRESAVAEAQAAQAKLSAKIFHNAAEEPVVGATEDKESS